MVHVQALGNFRFKDEDVESSISIADEELLILFMQQSIFVI